MEVNLNIPLEERFRRHKIKQTRAKNQRFSRWVNIAYLIAYTILIVALTLSVYKQFGY